MENRNNNQAPRTEGEARISVRPGNFIVPGKPEAPTKSGEKPTQNQNTPREGGEKGKGRHRNRHRHNKGRQAIQNGTGERRHEAPQKPKVAERPAEERKAPQNQPQKGPEGGKRRRDRHKKRDNRPLRQSEPKAPETVAEKAPATEAPLDNTFSLFEGLSAAPKTPKEDSPAVDTKEFEVDIATAAYLVEDIPHGFPAPGGNVVEVVGVRFRQSGKVYFFAPGEHRFRIGEAAIVDTARGEEFGEVVMLNRKMAEKDIVQPLRHVLRRATEADIAHNAENRKKEAEALRLCAEKIAAHKLEMKLVDAQYTFDNSKLLFYFTSEGRVDFRDLVRDLAGVFRTRIELRQIGIRDEARLIGGLGLCGRPFCCTTFLSDFGQVSVKMAKEQGLAINTSKTSGCCGRLICCLRYEQESYAKEAALTPPKNSRVNTPEGEGTVVESTPISGLLRVKLDKAAEEAPKVFHRDDVTRLS